MKTILAAGLALTLLAGEAHARVTLTELLFGKQSQAGQHVDDEAFGDEFKRPPS